MAESEKKPAPTYDEFKAAVKEHFLKYWQCDIPRATNYFKSVEAAQVIKEEYETDLRAYNEGEITYDVFMIGGVASVAYCLQLMCE